MCNIWQHPTNPREEITPALLENLPEVRTINITGGEPFLREDLADILSVLRRKAQRVVVSTSGYLTERILAVAGQHPWIGVRVSVEGLPAANDDLRGVKDGFDHALRTLVELKHAGIKDVGFGITLSDNNIDSLMPLYHMAKLMGFEFATAAVHNSFYFHKQDNAITRKDELEIVLRKLVNELLRSNRPKDWFRAYFNMGLIRYVHGKPRVLSCSQGTDCCFIDPYGNALLCNATEVPVVLGNLRATSFREIWESRQAHLAREKARSCKRHCWMIGSVAQPMKANIATVAKWVLREKIRAIRSGSPAWEGSHEN
jgi:Fe-coproporphyrin III synthase